MSKPTPSDPAATLPLIPASWGEVLDKISILEIKVSRLASEPALANVRRELRELNGVVEAKLAPSGEIAMLRDALRAVNTTLWDVEDAIRDKESLDDFGAEFVALARSVYKLNDERARIKRRVNIETASVLVEEKMYRDGQAPARS